MGKPFATYATEQNGHPVPCSRAAWLRWFGTATTRVDKTQSDTTASLVTEFSGINVAGAEPPEWYETRLYKGKEVDVRRCYATRRQALAGHRKIVQQMRSPT